MLRFDFDRIEGPESSRHANFELLCNTLLARLFPTIQAVDGVGGDEGLDAFIGVIDGRIHVYQHKFFLNRLRASQKRQIRESLQTAIQQHDVAEWTLLAPTEMTTAEHRWFRELQEENEGIEIAFWGKSRLLSLLAANQDVATPFLPADRPLVQILVGTSTHVDQEPETIAAAIEQSIRSDDVSDSIEPALMGIAQTIKRKTRLRVLVWGPGPSGGDLYDKRLEIKSTLEGLGHFVAFSEDELTADVLERTGLNLSVAEYLQAMLYDYVVCLMGSPGSVGEVHDFGHKPEIAQRMMVCIDEDHADGYSSNTVLRVFQGHNGKIDWFKYPVDIAECHLASRVIDQVECVAEARQWAQVDVGQ